MKNYFVIGVMSGTSIDGVDLVYANFFYEESWKFKIINSKTYEYDNEWQVILNRIYRFVYNYCNYNFSSIYTD